MTNEDKISKICMEKIRYRLGVSQFDISLLITCILAEQIDFEISHFHNFRASVTLFLDVAHCCVALIDLYLNAKFCSNRKNFVEGHTDVHAYVQTQIETSFIRSTRRS